MSPPESLSGRGKPLRLGWLNARKGVLQVLLPSLRLLPPRVALKGVSGLGQAQHALNPGLRHRYDVAVTRAAAHFGGDWDARAVGRRLAGNLLRWRVRDRL